MGGLPGWLSGKESPSQHRRRGFNPWVRKIPQRRKWQPNPVFLPGGSYGQRSLAGYSPWGHKELHTLNNRQGILDDQLKCLQVPLSQPAPTSCHGTLVLLLAVHGGRLSFKVK